MFGLLYAVTTMTIEFAYLPNSVATMVSPSLGNFNQFPITPETVSSFDVFIGCHGKNQHFFLHNKNTIWGIHWDKDTLESDKIRIINRLKLWHTFTYDKLLSACFYDLENIELWFRNKHTHTHDF